MSVRPPFKMLPSRGATLRCDGRFIVGGRASFVWETLLMRRASGVPGVHEIRIARGREQMPWHRVDLTIEEAEDALTTWSTFPERRRKQARIVRENRERQGLEVA